MMMMMANTKITKTYKESESTSDLQMAENKELGKYLS